MHHPTDRITHTMAFVTPDVEHWLEREMCPPCRIDPTTHRTMSERFYHGATSRSPGCTASRIVVYHGMSINSCSVIRNVDTRVTLKPGLLSVVEHWLEREIAH